MMSCRFSRRLHSVLVNHSGSLASVAEHVDAHHAVVEEFVDPRTAENRNLALSVQFEQPVADHLGHRQHSVDGVAEQIIERVGIDAAQLEP